MSNRSRLKSEVAGSTIPHWVVYALLTIVSLLIAKSVHGLVVTLTASGITMLFILSYLSKPVAKIQPVKENNIFEKNQMNKSTWDNPSEPNPQRKRYLKALYEETGRAA